MSPLIERKWSPEGIHFRREDVIILLPIAKVYYQIRRVNSKIGKPLEKGECNIISRREAFKMGNRLVRMMRKEKKLLNRTLRREE